ncbi:MAG: methytransferase partner Trm112 [Dehalococcoidales bacterium]|nr:methytransferase partner Trm112 [Dehalococcoidales bacterium]
MKRSLVEILVCPVCKGHLELTVAEEAQEIIRGILSCPKCNVDYPVSDGIPSLLPPEKTAEVRPG